ncbi:LOW QUALITY PROTEIN: WD repeat- and FYVE domain-containing protein 4 [Rhinoraja longicauda]
MESDKEKPKQHLEIKEQMDIKAMEKLERQISDYLHSLSALTQEEKQKSWNNLISLFLQIFDKVSNNWMVRFPSILPFSTEASRLMVQTINEKLAERSGDEAGFTVETYLRWKQDKGDGEGWKLLQTIHLLSTVDSEPLKNMVNTGLPLVLLKCIHLFFTFSPERDTEIRDERAQDNSTEFQETITHVMVNLCTQTSAVEAMIQNDDLGHLIAAVVSQWDLGSPWRKYTAHVLRAVSKTPTKSTVRYLHDNSYVKCCIEGLSAMAARSSVYVAAQAAVNVLCFVNDSYQVSGELLADFEGNEGYELLTMLLLGFDKELEKEEVKSLEELVDFLSSLTTYGEKELKVMPSVTGSQFPGFQFQQPPQSGTTVKNLQAFKVLQTVFLNSNCSHVSSIVLDRIRKIWIWNKANFFLLEWTQQIFFQFAEAIYLKSEAVQTQYFQMLRFVVFDLSYIPHDVFSRVQAVIRENLSPVCALLALECVLDISMYDPLLSIVFRETRLLEMLLTQLQRHAKILRKAGKGRPSDEHQHPKEALSLMLKVVAVMLQGSVKNTVILREYGMIPYIKMFLDDKSYRSHALAILEQLVIVNAEEYMRVVIGVLCSATRGEFMLKFDLLQSMLNVLGTAKASSAFRTTGGFNALQSVLADMEGALCHPPSGQWASVDQNDIWDLMEMTLCTLTVAIHADPVNSYFFRVQGHFDKMTEDFRLFGCFGSRGERVCSPLDVSACRKFKEWLDLAYNSTVDVPPSLRSCVKIFGFLDRMAKDIFSPPRWPSGTFHSPNPRGPSNRRDSELSGSDQNTSDASENNSEPATAGYGEDRFPDDPVIVHPGAICVMMHLLPNINCKEIPQLSLELQYAVSDYILSLVKTERCRQTMCGCDLLKILVNCFKEVLADNSHPLHFPLIRIFEKLACQAIDPPVLREFLRLGDPLNCGIGKPKKYGSSRKDQPSLSWHQVDTNELGRRRSLTRRGSLVARSRPLLAFSLSRLPRHMTIPQHRIMSLVSAMSSRHFHAARSTIAPPFTEFDMSTIGHGCYFLPTVATILGSNADSPIVGGVGNGLRGFPPPVGLTFSTWFMVNSFSSAFDAHPVRLLTLFRHTSKMEKDYTCLSIHIAAPQQQLVISTQEEVFEPLGTEYQHFISALNKRLALNGQTTELLQHFVNKLFTLTLDIVLLKPSEQFFLMSTSDWSDSEQSQRSSALTTVEFDVAKCLAIGQWHHLSVTLTKDVRRHSTVIAYLNGKAIGTSKMQYIQSFPGMHFTLESSAVVDVHGLIGTPQMWKQRSSLAWRLGPTYLLEEAISSETVEVIYQLGPNYLGNFQSVHLPVTDLSSTPVPSTLVAEEKVSFGINVISSNVMTITDIRKTFNEVDSRLISSELGISSRDDAMPIVVVKNTASHLPGSARTIGAALASFSGVRTFVSSPAANCLQCLGGPAVILGLVAMASDDGEMYAAIKVLISVLNGSSLCEREMQRIKGYRLLALLLRRRARLLNARIFQLVLTIVGTVELGRGTSTIHNQCAFRDLLCDFEIWLHAPEKLDLLLLRHLMDLLKSSDGGRNAEVMHRLQVPQRLVFLLNDPNNTRTKVHLIQTILADLLKNCFSRTDFLRIGLFLTYTLPPASMNERFISLERISDTSIDVINQVSGRTIWLRNQLLKMLLDVVCADQLTLSARDREKMFTSLGPDWFFLFLQDHLHPTTVILSTRLMLSFLYHPALLAKFRDGMAGNVWLANCTADCNILMDNIKSCMPAISKTPCLVPGLEMIQIFLNCHMAIPQIHVMLAALVLQEPLIEMPEDWEVDLDTMISWLFEQVRLNPREKSTKLPNGLCIEAALILLRMVRTLLNQPLSGTASSWHVTYPGSVIKFFSCAYHMFSNDPLWKSPEFLQALAAAAFHVDEAPSHTADWRLLVLEKPTCDAETQCHPAQKQVTEFIHVLLLDSLLNTPANKQLHPVEILVESSPAKATEEQRKSFQTAMLLFIMDILHNITEAYPMIKPMKDHVVSSLYSSLNRAILYCLSRPRQSLSDLQQLLCTLKFLQEEWDIIFATYNSSLSFIICLIHCPLSAILMALEWEPASKKASWNLQVAANREQYDGSFEPMHVHDVQKEVFDLVDWVWNRLMAQRRPALEDYYKIDLSVKQGSCEKVVGISEVSPLWEESASKAWLQYIASEKKNVCTRGVSGQLQQNKTEWFSEGLSTAVRLVGKRLSREPDDVTVKDFSIRMDEQRKTGQEVFASLHMDHMQMQKCIVNRAAKDWARVEEQLLQERGLWGPSARMQQGAWILDKAEGPARMRKKMRRQTICINYPQDARGTKEADSEIRENPGSELLCLKLCTVDEQTGQTDSQLYSAGESNIDEQGFDCSQLTFFPALTESVQSEEFFEQCVERQAILQALAEKDKITMKFSLIVTECPLLMESVLLIDQGHFYICENFTLSSSGDVYCTNHHPSSINDPYIYDMCNKEAGGKIPKCSRYSWDDVQEIHHRRFLLQDIAIEIFLKGGFSKFLIFHKNDKKVVLKKFYSMIPALKKGNPDNSRNLGKTLVEKGVIQKWQKGEMSNFEYLMHLNTLAGRTYNDLMQYPVFPWILADYDSEELDVTNARTFRDLSRPMGAQTEERKDKFIKRYYEIDHDGNLSARCHYCTHYSSAMIVASYLVRMEPFTEIFCSLQGGSFDVADRMFFNMKKEWESSSRDNMGDVRELTPEFFYLPEFLVNHNKLEFGSTQDGTTLGDVILPTWAKGDAREFIRLHRMALECDYVSAHLHHWIDLIFGCKQKGPNAIEAVNVFHPYFYDEQADLSNIDDPLKKDTILGFINNFGQIPKQLFKKAHPARINQAKHWSGKDHLLLASTQPIFYHLENLKPSAAPVTASLDSAVGQIAFTDRGVVAVEKNTTLLPPSWNKTFSWGYADFSCSLGNYGTDRGHVVFECLSDWGQCLCAVCPTAARVITGGTSTVICVWQLLSSKEKWKSMTLKEVLHGHTEAVTCLAVSLSYNVFVSGSCDRTCIVWDYNTMTYLSQLQHHQAPVTCVSINNTTGDIASCAGTRVYLWTLNGQAIASISMTTEPLKEILCCCFTEVHEWDDRNIVITGCSDGTVQLWKTEFTRVQGEHTASQHTSTDKHADGRWERQLVQCQELRRNGGPAITSLAISRNHTKLFVGDYWGCVYTWSVEG